MIMAASPGKKRKRGINAWMRLNQFVNFILSILLGMTAVMQSSREDAIVWVAIFLVPAAVTLASSFRLHLGARPEVKVVSSVHIACCLCLLMYLGIRLIHGMAHQYSSSILMYDGNEVSEPSYNPLNYREGWEILAVTMVVAWMKFLGSTVREHMKEAGIAAPDVSPQWMLKSLAVVTAASLVLASFCYIEGLGKAARILYGTVRDDISKMTVPGQ